MEWISDSAVECECETSGKPVDFLGDSVCRSLPSNVREIIKKYEPDRELIKETGSLGAIPSYSKPSNRLLFEESQLYPMRAITQQNVPKPVSTRSIDKPRTIMKKSITPSVPNRSLSDVRSQSESTYKSKTTITKIAQGVRITTDILFDTNNGTAPDQWIGRRIDTDVPQSKILLDFETKNGSLTK